MRKKVLSWAVLALALVLGSTAQAQTECLANVMCLTRSTENQTVTFRVQNHNPGPITVRFQVAGKNIITPVTFPYIRSFEGGTLDTAFVLQPVHRAAPLEYRYSFSVVYGGLNARHDDREVYALPYAPGTAHRVIQGYQGSFSHQDIYAIDWGMPTGTVVYAARAGRVVAACDSLVEGGIEDELEQRANHVLVLHEDGTVATYAHLQPEGVLVEVGEKVRRGQPIGRSGNTGYSGSPHLHFEVYRVVGDLKLQTVPVRFEVAGGEPSTLEEGQQYRAPPR